MKNFLVAAAFAIYALAQVATAHAGTTHGVWSSVASGCSLTNNVGTVTTAGASIATSNGGNITLFCPVHNIGPDLDTLGCSNVNSLWVTLKSSTSATNSGGVYPFLIKVNLSNGSETVIANSTGTPFHSTLTTTPNQSNAIGLSEALDFSTYAYYVQVQMIGNATVHSTQTVYAISLGCFVF